MNIESKLLYLFSLFQTQSSLSVLYFLHSRRTHPTSLHGRAPKGLPALPGTFPKFRTCRRIERRPGQLGHLLHSCDQFRGQYDIAIDWAALESMCQPRSLWGAAQRDGRPISDAYDLLVSKIFLHRTILSIIIKL